jgi:tetratricopeptide (TPR) repeat protein
MSLVGALLGSPKLAVAQAPDPQRASAAQALFDEANDDLEKQRFATACPKLEEVTKLVPDALGARVALAECYEGLGKLASAWSQYALVEGLAIKAGQAERAEKAGKRAADLKPRLATLKIHPASGLGSVPGLAITRDGVDVGKGQWSVAVPVDVGTHAILVTAPGYKPWKKSVEILADGAGTVVEIPVLTIDPSGGVRIDRDAVRPWQRPLAIGAMAAGGAGIVAGALLGGLAIAKNGESNQGACNAHNQCTEAGLAMRSQALSLGNGSTAAFVVGGVLAAGGVVLLLTAPPRDKTSPKTGFADLRLGVMPGGLELEGAW